MLYIFNYDNGSQITHIRTQCRNLPVFIFRGWLKSLNCQVNFQLVIVWVINLLQAFDIVFCSFLFYVMDSEEEQEQGPAKNISQLTLVCMELASRIEEITAEEEKISLVKDHITTYVQNEIPMVEFGSGEM